MSTSFKARAWGPKGFQNAQRFSEIELNPVAIYLWILHVLVNEHDCRPIHSAYIQWLSIGGVPESGGQHLDFLNKVVYFNCSDSCLAGCSCFRFFVLFLARRWFSQAIDHRLSFASIFHVCACAVNFQLRLWYLVLFAAGKSGSHSRR